MPKNKIFFKFLVSYFIILAIAIIPSLYFYYNNINRLKSEVINNNSSLLKETSEILTRRISEVEGIAQLLCTNSNVIKFQTVKKINSKSNIHQVITTQNKLPNFNLTNNFIIDYFILYGNNNIVLNKNLVYNMDEFYKYYLNYSDMTYEQWKSNIFSNYNPDKFIPNKKCTLQEKDNYIVSYIKPLGDFSYSKTCIFIIINNERFTQLLKKLCSIENSWACIVDSNNNIISYYGNKNELDNLQKNFHYNNIKGNFILDNTLVTYNISNVTNWKFVMGQPYNKVIEKVSHTNVIAIITLSVSIFIALLLSYLMANKNTQPISAIIKSINTKHYNYENKNAYQIIQSTLNNLYIDNEKLKQNMVNQTYLIKDSFFRRLLKGEIKTIYELEKLMNYTNLNIKGNWYGAVVIRLNGYEDNLNDSILKDLDFKRMIIQEIFKNLNYDNLYLHIVSQDTFVLMYWGNFEDKNHLKCWLINTINTMNSELLRQNDIHMSFAVGNMYHSLFDVALSYKQANSLISYSQLSDNKIIWYDEHLNNTTRYFFPSKTKSRLTTVLKKGSKEEAKEILDNLYYKNFIETTLPIQFIYLFLLELANCILKTFDTLNNKNYDIYNQIIDVIENIMLSKSKKDKLFKQLENIIYLLIEDINQNKKSHNYLLIQNIIEYINNNYYDPNLSLSQIGSTFGLSEVYLSQFFKEQTGKNLSSIIEEKRMDKAIKLLISTNWSIKKIAEYIGYNSQNSFSRAFKRNYSISASTYRNQKINSELKG